MVHARAVRPCVRGASGGGRASGGRAAGLRPRAGGGELENARAGGEHLLLVGAQKRQCYRHDGSLGAGLATVCAGRARILRIPGPSSISSVNGGECRCLGAARRVGGRRSSRGSIRSPRRTRISWSSCCRSSNRATVLVTVGGCGRRERGGPSSARPDKTFERQESDEPDQNSRAAARRDGRGPRELPRRAFGRRPGRDRGIATCWLQFSGWKGSIDGDLYGTGTTRSICTHAIEVVTERWS